MKLCTSHSQNQVVRIPVPLCSYIPQTSRDVGIPLQPFSTAPCTHGSSPVPKRAPEACGCSPRPAPAQKFSHLTHVQSITSPEQTTSPINSMQCMHRTMLSSSSDGSLVCSSRASAVLSRFHATFTSPGGDSNHGNPIALAT